MSDFLRFFDKVAYKYKLHLINIFNSVEIWTWKEYQEIQGFNVSSRLLEIIS